MMSITFDSLSAARRLREKGASQELAEAIADELRASKEVDISHLATKEELNSFKSELKADLRELEFTLKAEMKSDKAEIIKWMFGGFIALASFQAAAVGIAVSILKLH